MRFEIWFVDDVEPRYFWHLGTDEGRILAWSEDYPTKAACMEAIAAIRAGAPAAGLLDRTGQPGTPSRGPG